MMTDLERARWMAEPRPEPGPLQDLARRLGRRRMGALLAVVIAGSWAALWGLGMLLYRLELVVGFVPALVLVPVTAFVAWLLAPWGVRSSSAIWPAFALALLSVPATALFIAGVAGLLMGWPNILAGQIGEAIGFALSAVVIIGMPSLALVVPSALLWAWSLRKAFRQF